MKDRVEQHKFLGTYKDLLEVSLGLYPNLQVVTLEFPSVEFLINNLEIFTDSQFNNYFNKFWIQKLEDDSDYCEESWTSINTYIRAKGTMIFVFENQVKVIKAESIKVKTCCNKRLKYLNKYIITDANTMVCNAIDITDQYKIDEATARIISQWNRFTYFQGYSIIQQADIVDLTLDNDNVDLIQSLESIENLKLCIKIPKEEKHQEIEEEKTATRRKFRTNKYQKTNDPHVLNKYTDLLVVLCYTRKLYKTVKIEVVYEREEFDKNIESQIEIFYFTRLLEDLSELRVVSLDLNFDLQTVLSEVSTFVFNNRHINKLTLYDQHASSTFDNLQTRSKNIVRNALKKLGDGEWLLQIPCHVWNDIHFTNSKEEV